MNSNNKFNLNTIIVFVCTGIYILYTVINNMTGDQISTMILLGTDYKTFTLGLGEYWRLFTSGFCHFSLIHLLCNMVSLLSLGNFILTVYGNKKYLIFLFTGIIVGSLSSGILNTNTIESGLSSGLYTFFIIFILYIFTYHKRVSGNFFSIILINFGMNFIPNVAWQAHLGGAIVGIIFFVIEYYEQEDNKGLANLYKLLVIVLTIGLFIKYNGTKKDIIDYPGTDIAYVNYVETHFPQLKDHYYNKMIEYYKGKEDLYE